MIITKIKQQTKKNNIFSVFIDNKFAFSIEDIDLVYYKLEENQIIDEKKYKDIMENVVFSKAKSLAIYYLGFKMRTESQIIKKLSEAKFPEDIIIKVIQLLKNYNYINDFEFAKAFIKDKALLSNHGSVKIKSDLKLSGVSQNIINKAFEKVNLKEEEIALELLLKKTIGINKNYSNYKEKQKLISYLLRRGFPYDVCKTAFENFILINNN